MLRSLQLSPDYQLEVLELGDEDGRWLDLWSLATDVLESLLDSVVVHFNHIGSYKARTNLVARHAVHEDVGGISADS